MPSIWHALRVAVFAPPAPPINNVGPRLWIMTLASGFTLGEQSMRERDYRFDWYALQHSLRPSTECSLGRRVSLKPSWRVAGGMRRWGHVAMSSTCRACMSAAQCQR